MLGSEGTAPYILKLGTLDRGYFN